MDKIEIKDLRLRCVIGVDPDERGRRQEVCISITLYADLRPAGRTDDLADTVDYRAVQEEVRRAVEQSSFFLVEKLAAEVAGICVRAPGVERAVVRVEKPGALELARTVAVEIERDRGEFG